MPFFLDAYTVLYFRGERGGDSERGIFLHGSFVSRCSRGTFGLGRDAVSRVGEAGCRGGWVRDGRTVFRTWIQYPSPYSFQTCCLDSGLTKVEIRRGTLQPSPDPYFGKTADI